MDRGVVPLVTNTGDAIMFALTGALSDFMSFIPKLIGALVERSVGDYEPQFGGFGSAPKFPRETLLELLLLHQRHAPHPERMRMIRSTLDAMMYGGIRDQLGGGFHRYSTDDVWLAPHFEKMLYLSLIHISEPTRPY